MSEQKSKETPLMKQYNEVKEKYPNTIILFRVGDFYETFSSDAILTSGILNIVLTKRANGSASEIELAGFPYHSLDTYLPKIVKAGHRVAICEQLEDPKMTKTLVKRGVTEVISPGVTLNDKLLENKENNFICSIHKEAEKFGISFLDISTGEFFIDEGNLTQIQWLVQKYKPSEFLFIKHQENIFYELFGKDKNLSQIPDWIFKIDYAQKTLLEHFNTNSLKGYGIEEYHLGKICASSILYYIKEYQYSNLIHINNIYKLKSEDYLILDLFSTKNLEIFESLNYKGKTLFEVLDKTITSMGGRMMRNWIGFPLLNQKIIEKRLDVTEFFKENIELSFHIENNLKQIIDIERICGKLATQKINPRELTQLGNTLERIGVLKGLLLNNTPEYLKFISSQLNPCTDAIILIKKYIKEDAPLNTSKGDIINSNVSEELDELREITNSSKNYLEKIEKEERIKTGINSLKIGFNNVFGYYLEVRNTYKDQAPLNWIRKQTLTNAERYITEELKSLEEKILTAQEKILILEQNLFIDLLNDLISFLTTFQLNSKLISEIDCLHSFGKVSRENKYSRPKFVEESKIELKNARHPVIEKTIPLNDQYIPNDILINDQQQILIITGPNMSGKSSILRMVAINCLMAQMGCFIASESGEIEILDKVFTRVGASDNISLGESTFMVEMNETACILNNLSAKSLLILDEIGRGTSTYDGISIAWGIVEFIHEHPLYKPKTIFATHYHELNEMSQYFKKIKNFHITIKENKKKILFLRKLEEGGSEHSFGINVAILAGMPRYVIEKAENMLKFLEKSHNKNSLLSKINTNQKNIYENSIQLKIFETEDETFLTIKKIMKNIDLNSMTPIDAILKLNELKKLVTNN